MLQFQGWIEVALAEDDAASISAIDRELNEHIRVIRNRMVELRVSNDIELVARNGSHLLFVNAMREHEPGMLDRLRTLLDEIGRRALGSYGVFYFRDSEFAAGRFQRLVMRRGQVELFDDDLFNPAIPTIEDSPTTTNQLEPKG